MEQIFKDDNLMLKLNVIHKLRRWLLRERQGYASWLQHRIGVGLSKADFEWCIKMLEVSGCCTVTIGEKGGMILTSRESSNTTFYSPEEVIADAMQCPPNTEELLSEVK